MRVTGLTGLFSAVSMLFAAADAKEIFIQVGMNTTNNATAVFEPRSVKADLNDVVVFNFTQGGHTVTESAFYAPCEPNADRNGFDSGVRTEANSILTVPITPDIEDMPLFFYDDSLCSQGGVGVINENSTSGETLEGFERNAMRLYSSTSSSSSQSQTSSPAPSSSGSDGEDEDDTDVAMRSVLLSGASLIPALLLATGSLLI